MLGWSQEDQDYEFNARFDYLREAYGAEVDALRRQSQNDDQYEQQQEKAFCWLLAQGGLVEVVSASQKFDDATFDQLERDGRIKRIILKGCSQVYWAINEQYPVYAVAPIPAQPPIDENDIPF